MSPEAHRPLDEATNPPYSRPASIVASIIASSIRRRDTARSGPVIVNSSPQIQENNSSQGIKPARTFPVDASDGVVLPPGLDDEEAQVAGWFTTDLKSEKTGLGSWLINHHYDDLFGDSSPSGQVNDPETNAAHHWNLSLAGLNRLRLRKLQMQLVQRVLHMRYYREEPEDWEDLLDKYGRNLIQDQ